MTGKEMAADTVVTLKAGSQPSTSGGNPLPVQPTCTSTTLPEHTPHTAITQPRDGFRPTDSKQQGHESLLGETSRASLSALFCTCWGNPGPPGDTTGRRQGSPRQWTWWKRARSIIYILRFQTFICHCSITYPVPTNTGTLRFSRQDHWSGMLCPPPGDLPDPETLVSCTAGRFFTAWAT